ncbi:Gpr1 family protein [Collybia nuda]|uniref:Gpr1 family protein n=1 Tax=Collybia nuda TaxID=64659 RepID=A0A9P6CF91_9AGAR|nr:Gpr1 family protein [Collybia nuda]
MSVHERDASSVGKSLHEDLEPGGVTTERPTRIADAAPVGLFMFASTTLLASLYNVNTRGIHTTNAILGMAIFGGGLVQLIAGMWQCARGHVFGAATFSSYGAFWMSYSVIAIPGFGVFQAFPTEAEFRNAHGMYLIVWFMITALFVPSTLPRKTLAMTVLLTCVAMNFLLLGISELTGSRSVQLAGGAFGIIVAFVAYYIGLSDLLAAEEHPFIVLPQDFRKTRH